MKKILILGGTGMLGHTLFTHLSGHGDYDVYATARVAAELPFWFPPSLLKKIRTGVDADNFDTVIRALAAIQPDIVINCIGLIKQSDTAKDPLSAITINSQLPHRISLICRVNNARMIHISTDCVFNGTKGDYSEEDIADAQDLYGRTKLLGEVSYSHCLTLRTSIIGHELKGYLGLVEWFLSQRQQVRGFIRAIFSGLTTIELAEIIRRHVLPNDELQGVLHVSSAPISKFDLLQLIAARYRRALKIEADSEFTIDRSLNSELFRQLTGYQPPSWPDLIEKMHDDFLTAPHYLARNKKA